MKLGIAWIIIKNLALKFEIVFRSCDLKQIEVFWCSWFIQLIDCISFVDPAAAAASQDNKEEADARSVFVGNVWISLFFIFYSFSIGTMVPSLCASFDTTLILDAKIWLCFPNQLI